MIYIEIQRPNQTTIRSNCATWEDAEHWIASWLKWCVGPATYSSPNQLYVWDDTYQEVT